MDGVEWHELQGEGEAYLEVLASFSLDEALIHEIGTYVNQGLDEPLGHLLFREAWNQRITNPTSALVIGMSAAEVAIKQFVSILVPDAEWLVLGIATVEQRGPRYLRPTACLSSAAFTTA